MILDEFSPSRTRRTLTAGGRTLREAMAAYDSGGVSSTLAGTPDTVAARMAEIMQEVGGDGFL